MFLQQVFGAVGIAAVGGSVNPMVAVAAEEQPVKLPSGTSYVVVKSGDGPQPSIGELAGIRFRAEVVQTGNKIDDIFDTPEPYYTRIGSGGLLKVRVKCTNCTMYLLLDCVCLYSFMCNASKYLNNFFLFLVNRIVTFFQKGVEEVLPKMRVGDRFLITIPVSHYFCYYYYVTIIKIYNCICRRTRLFHLATYLYIFIFQSSITTMMCRQIWPLDRKGALLLQESPEFLEMPSLVLKLKWSVFLDGNKNLSI